MSGRGDVLQRPNSSPRHAPPPFHHYHQVRCLTKPGVGVLPEGEPILDARLSEDGKTVGFVCAAEVYTLAVDEAEAMPVQATFGARGSGFPRHLRAASGWVVCGR